MSTYFNEKNPNLMVVVPPNSEAAINVQRLGTEMRTVGSYYINCQPDHVYHFLNCFCGSFLIDVPFSYYNCRDLYHNLLQNCASLYRNDLKSLESSLSFVESCLSNKLEDSLFIIPDEVGLTSSKKYLRLSGRSIYMTHFKEMILGDIVEIVFKKISPTLVVIYLRPREGVVSATASLGLFQEWLKKHLN